jgi:peptidoglycan-N-acetylglucosamine deacetylase
MRHSNLSQWETYYHQNLKISGEFDKNKVIYKEIPPCVHLEDLAPEPIYRGNPQKPMVAFLINY